MGGGARRKQRAEGEQEKTGRGFRVEGTGCSPVRKMFYNLQPILCISGSEVYLFLQPEEHDLAADELIGAAIEERDPSRM
jgi:hypothetical protein